MRKEEGGDCGLEKSLREQWKPGHLQAGKPELFSHVQDHILVSAITTSSLSRGKQLPLSSSKKLHFLFPSSFHLPLCPLSLPCASGSSSRLASRHRRHLDVEQRQLPCRVVLPPRASHDPALSTWCTGGIIPEWTVFSQKISKLGDIFHRPVMEWSNSLLCSCKLETRRVWQYK